MYTLREIYACVIFGWRLCCGNRESGVTSDDAKTINYLGGLVVCSDDQINQINRDSVRLWWRAAHRPHDG
jgi:hypothetical protein